MKDVYYPSAEPLGRVPEERYDLVGMRSASRHGVGSQRFHQGSYVALWSTKYPVRNPLVPGTKEPGYDAFDTRDRLLPTEWIVSRHNEDNQEYEELLRTTDRREARRFFDAFDEQFPQSDLPQRGGARHGAGRPSTLGDSKPVLVDMPLALVDRIDARIAHDKMSRNEFIRLAVEQELAAE